MSTAAAKDAWAVTVGKTGGAVDNNDPATGKPFVAAAPATGGTPAAKP